MLLNHSTTLIKKITAFTISAIIITSSVNVFATEVSANNAIVNVEIRFTRADYPEYWILEDGTTARLYFNEIGSLMMEGRRQFLVPASRIHLPNQYNGGVINEHSIRNGFGVDEQIASNNEAVTTPSTTTQPPNLQTDTDNIQPDTNGLLLLTDDELLEWIEQAPSHFETRSQTALLDRRITDTELENWIAEYQQLGANAFELEVIRLINIVRVEHNLQPLAISQNLMMAARFHSQEMEDLNYTSHISPNHGRSSNRASMFGHQNVNEDVWGVRENIAGGTRTPQSTVNGWLNSPGHRAAILDESFVSIGVGRVNGSTVAKFGS